MIAGNIGSSSIMSYTVIGDNVNLGSRLESLNKDYRTRIIISDATRARLKGDYDIRPLGDVMVKGKTRPVAIFEVMVPSPLPTAHEEADDMKNSMHSHSRCVLVARRPRSRAARRRARQARTRPQTRSDKVDDLKHLRGRRAEDRRAGQPAAVAGRSASFRTRRSRST